MRLTNNAHLAYCTNVHPGNDWPETFRSLQNEVMAVRQTICPKSPYAIGLRLSDLASRQLSRPQELADFQRWLEKNECYVFTINGFPFGAFHGQRVKEQVYRPDWTSPERLEYTKRLFDILSCLLPAGVSGSVSTLPGSFKRFIENDSQIERIHENLLHCFAHIESICERHQIDLHLGLEPEPLGLFETSRETVDFFARFIERRAHPDELLHRIGVNYDTCHLAVEFEEPHVALARLVDAGIRLSKIHLSSALRLETINNETKPQLQKFCEETYLHQVVAKPNEYASHEDLKRYEDLPIALKETEDASDDEWRIHFHIPIHHEPSLPFHSTRDHLLGTLDYWQNNPDLCQHFEIETYTWQVLPTSAREGEVVDQITREYQWILAELDQRGLRPESASPRPN